MTLGRRLAAAGIARDRVLDPGDMPEHPCTRPEAAAREHGDPVGPFAGSSGGRRDRDVPARD